ncbi:MAG TPA: hypothetical protein VFB42_02990 [Gaiellaceae bacterium]|nr:hypothetical protein [Gaiellaceae bacterium]
MAVVLLGLPVVTAFLVAAAARLRSLVSTLLAAYLALVVNLGAVTWALSPLRLVTQGGLAATEALLLAAAAAGWWLRGRPLPSLGPARAALREVALDPVSGLFLAVVAALLGYELALALGAPANNWDSLTYHLARAAAWMHHGGVYEIPNPPSANFNEFPPLAEQQILYGFVATRSGALLALPQYLAELAILVAVYGAARRLGHGPRPSACAAFLLATFSFVALQATTAQNDLFAASFPAASACLLLGGAPLELALGGAAAGAGLGAKPTTAFVLPVLALLALLRGRRAFGLALGGGLAGFAAAGVWVYVLNLVHAGSLFGEGGWTTIGASSQQSLEPGPLSTFVDVVYQVLDLSVLSDRVVSWLELGGIAAGLAVSAAYALRRRRLLRSVLEGGSVALPLLAPVIVIGASGVVAWLARRGGFPVRGPGGNVGTLNRTVTGGAFGPVGGVVLLGVPLLVAGLWLARRADARRLALALALPLFLLLLAQATYNWFLTRFLLSPAVLTAPLFPLLMRTRAAIAAYLVAGATVAALVVTRDPQRPLDGSSGRPWSLTQVEALRLSDLPEVGDAAAAYARLVPPHACVGAVLDPNEPAFVLSGPRLGHRVEYLPVDRALAGAYEHHLSYVVLTRGVNGWAARQFASGGWTVRPLGSYWRLAVARFAGDGDCG